MAGLRRYRPAMFVAGAALALGTLLGAGALTAGHGTASDGSRVSPPAGGKATGPIVLGTVDSDPPPIDFRLPPVLQSGTIAETFVKDGQDVKAGDKLYRFDTTFQQTDLARAQATVEVAQTKVAEANEAVKQHGNKIDLAKQAVSAAKDKETWQNSLYKLVEGQVKEGLKKSGIPEAQWAEQLAIDRDLYRARVDYGIARNELKLRQAELAALEAADPKVMVKQAEAGVAQAKAEVAKAQTAIDLCTITAKTAGTVERVTISPGATLGISTRDPALWLIPAGDRVVRAEVEAEFAHRVGPSLEGREVTVYDNTDPKLTYRGRVRRIGSTFLPKRSFGDGFLPNDTRAIEVVVEVPAAPPAGLPPLRVGQRVRVNLGQ